MGVAVGGAVAGVSVLVVLILLTITAVWVARKKYHKEQGWRIKQRALFVELYTLYIAMGICKRLY